MFHRSNITHCYHVTENELDSKQSSIQLTGRPEEWMDYQPVRDAVSYRGLFTAGWFGMREKYCSQLEIYDHLRANEQAECRLLASIGNCVLLKKRLKRKKSYSYRPQPVL